MNIEVKHLARFELLMDAGQGAQKAGDILIRAFARVGKYVFSEPMIPAEISPPPRTRPAMSGVIIRIADFDITNIGNDADLILSSHEIVLDRRLDDEESNPACRILLDIEDRTGHEEAYDKVGQRAARLGLSIIPFELDADSKTIIKSLGGRGKNLFYLGMLAAVYNMTPESVRDEVHRTFTRMKEEALEQNLRLYDNGYRFARENVPFAFEIPGTPHSQNQILIDGNSAMSLGVVDAGIKLYSGYPITPASSIMHTLAKIMPSYGGIVHQAEDEISAVGTVLGSYFGGVPAITATSGPGLSLMQEFVGYAQVAEIPMLVIDAQRAGPSTGMPTKTEQSDLPAVLFGSHGDNTKIVISVADATDCFYAPQLARYLAEKLRLPVFILSDFQMANSFQVIEPPRVNRINDIDDVPDFVFERFGMRRLQDAIEMVHDKQAVPGTPEGMRRVTGLNTDAQGSISYFAGNNQRAHRIRNDKVHHVRRALRRPDLFGPDSGRLLVIGWGTTRGAIQEAVTNCRLQGLDVSGLHCRIVYPLPLSLKELFSRFDRVMSVELSYGDNHKFPPLTMLSRLETLADVRPLISGATGRPVRPRTIKGRIEEVLAAMDKGERK